MSAPRFVVDNMLGNVARWLRMLGYDTLYDRDYGDWEILRVAERDDRVVITRDRSLHNRALNRGIRTIYLHVDDMAKRLAYIALHAGIRLYVDLESSRCPLCNTELRKVPKDRVRDLVPPRVYRVHEDFWICSKCNKAYWIGRHWVKIEETLSEARKALSEYKSRHQAPRGVESGRPNSSTRS